MAKKQPLKPEIIRFVAKADRQAALFLQNKIGLQVRRQGMAMDAGNWFDIAEGLYRDEDVKYVALVFINSFPWIETPQGSDYWNDIYWKVNAL